MEITNVGIRSVGPEFITTFGKEKLSIFARKRTDLNVIIFIIEPEVT